MGDNNDKNIIKNKKRFTLNTLFLGTLFTNTIFDIIIIIILPFGMNLLILLTIVTFLWGFFAIVRKRIRYFIGFCVINLAPILILINATFNSDDDNIKYILIKNSKNVKLNNDQKKFILVASILKIIIEVIFIIIAIIICNVNYEKSGETEKSEGTKDTNSKKLNIIQKFLEGSPGNIYIAYKLFNFSLYLSLYFILIMNGILSLYGFEFIPTKDIGHLVLFTICLFIPSFFILYLSNKTIKKKNQKVRIFKYKYLLIVDISLGFQIAFCIALLLYIGLKYKNYRNYCNIITIPIITMISSLLTIITSILFYRKSKNKDFIDEFFILYLKQEYKLHSDNEYDHQDDDDDDDDVHENILTEIIHIIDKILIKLGKSLS
ncbi:hypothetical protein RhiirA5_406846 [Rhizophagus irregularis]|uniref:Uncharacterized protein n=2 Tax=Rhizophagus irregularis TaxID=588596 RepID=A0A2I1EDV7_9GLOM|nr:hypothetical protein GLOIN_2v1761951 [Rhizophagus irregularis DAOM 181602=DAOM 197198]PKC16606.1 hypothetical protein RhiirA5_406846 [Rhizophagus irregularis]PKC69572.1 hypothetical protein RhiirA1_455843 [Rhizophagus irregularis]PKY20308.1 hypothetical protein RhiirB3_433578 [Rhizophagus irregularis]POG82554.1 hypothetical protein GLOIN_2v1761951 [Rhizophagus irregularis DAOM 181602=DAOM 197198]UZO17525.1 hypothetical protein OCT59_008877 [Rhizophagus irregularis]|eukprot:XP_025189420.1 hypothetical protein GLOIN_2v1761951 [Rhizophagus irregularis DAOM 181602=DAOM 197198]